MYSYFNRPAAAPLAFRAGRLGVIIAFQRGRRAIGTTGCDDTGEGMDMAGWTVFNLFCPVDAVETGGCKPRFHAGHHVSVRVP